MSALLAPVIPPPLHSPRVDAVKAAAEQAGLRLVVRARRARDLARTLDSLTIERATHRQTASCCVARPCGRCRTYNDLGRAIVSHQHELRRLLRRIGGQ